MTKASRVTFLSSLGVGLEYYDFIIYGLLSPYLSPLFFSEDQWLDGLLKIFAIFSLGYLARPLGGIIFGVIADRTGRKASFIVIMLLMAFSTLLIGLLPTANQIGVFAPIFLTILRLIQGISFGAELPGAITIINEYARKNDTGLHSGFVISSTGIGAALASIVLMILTTSLSPQDMKEWGWRIPFIFGGILAIISYITRSRLEETPAFQLIQEQRKNSSFFSPFLELIKEYKKEIGVCIMLNFLTSSLVIMNIYYYTYLKTFFNYSDSHIFQAVTISILGVTPILPFLGRLGDKYGRDRVLLISIFLFIGFGYFVFHILNNEEFFSLLGFLFFQQVFTCASITSTLPITAAIFPTRIRFTGIGICYNFAYVVASLIPVFLTYIFKIYPNPMIVFYSLVAISFSAAIILFSNNKTLNQKGDKEYNLEAFSNVS
jgi:MHS family proline/betaine transporter-like MFS transporter